MIEPAKFNNVISFLWAIADLASGEGVARTVNDCCCGTGGMLTLTKDHIQQINPQSKVFLYGQELNPQAWAIARSDMLILEPEGKDTKNIKFGSTLSNDQLSDKRFDFQFVNPPYGYEWSKDYAAVTTREPMRNNTSVPQRLGQRGLKPETLPSPLPSSFSRFTFQRSQLFASTQIPACLGFFAKNRHDGKCRDNQQAA